MMEDAGLTISALSCHGNPLHPDPADPKADDEVFRKTVRLAEQLERAGRRHVLGLPGRLRTAHASQLGHHALAARVPRGARLAVGEEGDPLLDEDAARLPRDHGVKVALEAHPGFLVYNVETALQAAARVRRAISASTSIRAISSGRAWTCRRRFARWVTPSSTCTPRTWPRSAERRGERRDRHQNLYAAWRSARGCSAASASGHDELEWKRIVSALRLAGYDYVVSIEHEDALASIDEGLGRRSTCCIGWS